MISDIESYLDYLANTYPEICQMETIGQSSEGRPIRVLKVSTGGPKKPSVWIDGGALPKDNTSVCERIKT